MIKASPKKDKLYQVRTRYRAPLIEGKIILKDKSATIELKDEVRAVTPGQSAVVYDNDQVLGGGIVV